MKTPPRLAVLLLETLLPSESRETVIGDLLEAHELRAAENRLVAWFTFWRETFAALALLQLSPPNIAAFTPYTLENRVQSFLSDLRHAVRVLARARGFTALCILTLGVAIGATTAIYSIVNPVLLQPLPYPHPERLMLVFERERDGQPSSVGYDTFLDFKRQARTLEHISVMGFWQPTIFGEHDAERLNGQVVSWEYFRTLGVHPMLGRDFDEAEDTPDTRNVVILSHGLWARRFGSDPAIVGQTINTGGLTRRVIGVMPAAFDNVLSPEAEMWRPIGYAEGGPSSCRTCRHLRIVARVRDGVSNARANQEINALHARMVADHPKDYASTGALTPGVQDETTQATRPVLLALFGAALLVLVIAGANVVSLQLAQSVRRQDEFAVRAALGAGRLRLAGQLLAEGLVLAFVGGVAGVVVAATALPLLVSRLPERLPRVNSIHLDLHALGFVATCVILIGVVVGLVPAMQHNRISLFDSLRSGTRTLGVSRHRVRKALVIGEIALALMLVVGAGLLAQSLRKLLDVDPGFDATHLVTVEVQATGPRYETKEAVLANHDRLLAAVAAVPGVVGVGLTTQLPLSGYHDQYGIAARDKPLENPELAPSADRYTVNADFLSVMHIPIIRGRNFDPAEATDSNAHVAIVSQALASRIWPGEDAIGKSIRLGDPTRPWREVIGIAGNIRHSGLDATQTQQVYVPEHQWPWAEDAMVLVARTRGDPSRMAGAIHEAVRDVDQLQPISNLRTMEDVVSRSTSQRRFGLLLFVTFGVIALLLASAGIYGILAGVVEERTREFGVRCAMGATPAAVVGLVLRQAGGLALTGIGLGGVLAFAFSRYLRALLYGIQPTDPVALIFGTATILAVALAACLIPARRAARVDPMTALRSD